MNKFNPIFIRDIYHRAHPILQSDGFALSWKTVKLLDNITTYRVIIFRFQLGPKGFVNVTEFGRTKDLVFSVRAESPEWVLPHLHHIHHGFLPQFPPEGPQE